MKVIFIYLFALIFLRAGGKRSRQQLTPLEMLLVVALGSAVGDVMFYPNVPLIYPMLIIVLVVVIQYAVNRLKRHFNKVQLFINSGSRMLVEKGQVRQEAMDQENITMAELCSVLRKSGIRNMNQVEYAYLELSGDYSVFQADQPIQGIDQEIMPAPKIDPFYSA